MERRVLTFKKIQRRFVLQCMYVPPEHNGEMSCKSCTTRCDLYSVLSTFTHVVPHASPLHELGQDGGVPWGMENVWMGGISVGLRMCFMEEVNRS